MPSSSCCLLAVTVNARVGAVNQEEASSSDFPLRVLGHSAPSAVRPHERVLAECDTFGFATTSLGWRDVGLKLHCCHWSVLGRETTPRCYVECVNDPHQPLLPFRVSDAPELLEEDILLRVFPYTPLPPVLHQRVVAFIQTNVTPLLQHWYGALDSADLLEVLREPRDTHS